MNIAIFGDITTEEALIKIEADAEKYDGLYVDMDDAKQRKYVKDNASLINGILKRLDRARIDKAKDYKVTVENEAARIKERLLAANEPFTLLIDEHAAKRAAILAAEKAHQEAVQNAIQLQLDHETGLMLDKIFDIEQVERDIAKIKYEDELREQGKAQAIMDAEFEKSEHEAVEAAASANRMADIKYKAGINREILKAILSTGITEEQAKAVIKLAANGAAGQMRVYY